jgi:hypothetical protein
MKHGWATFPLGNNLKCRKKLTAGMLAEHCVQVAWSSASRVPGTSGQRCQGSAEKSNYCDMPWAVPRDESMVRVRRRPVQGKGPCGVYKQLSIWYKKSHRRS